MILVRMNWDCKHKKLHFLLKIKFSLDMIRTCDKCSLLEIFPILNVNFNRKFFVNNITVKGTIKIHINTYLSIIQNIFLLI